jgi:hypothetical protein
VAIEALEPRAVVGPRTGVEAVFRVRWGTEPRPHLVFHDRHGWYCEEHGRGCDAVEAARGAGAGEG